MRRVPASYFRRAVVDAHIDQLIKRPDGPDSGQAGVNFNVKCFAVEIIQHIECAEAPPTSQGIGHEIGRSSLIWNEWFRNNLCN